MEAKVLALFLDVARLGSFAAGARRHNLDPSSASRAIAALEQELGVGLFLRTTRSLSLTEGGEMFFQRVEPLVDELAQACEAAQLNAARPHGTLRILAPVSFALQNVIPLLPSWLAANPNIKLDLKLNDALLDLVDERIDIALRLGPLSDSTYTARKLCPMWNRVCASPSYIKLHGVPKEPQALQQHTCLGLDMPGFGERWSFRNHHGQEFFADVAVRVRTSNALALKQLAVSGVGVVLQAEWIVGRELASGELVDLFPDFEVTSSTFDNAVWIVQPPRQRTPIKTKSFCDFLLQQFRDGPPWAARVERSRSRPKPTR